MIRVIRQLPLIAVLRFSIAALFPLLMSGAPAAAEESAPAAAPETEEAEQADPAGDDIFDLDIDQLGNVDVVVPAFDEPVSSVTKSESTVGRSPAAIFVVTSEMIRRSGATSLPEVLRMVPGLNVARINANSWAVSARGFNDQFANKLLVLIDGRTVYTPFFAGVHWDVQDVVLQDIERIEVIRGPGSTLWGANAVNGVINVITKKAKDTQGTLIAVGGGSEDKSINVARYGGRIGEDIYYRVYGKHFERDDAFAPAGGAHDDWRQKRVGFRSDWTPGGSDRDFVTLQGDIYEGASESQGTARTPNPPFIPFLQAGDTFVAGGDLLGRWTRRFSDESDFTLQAYYDTFSRDGSDIDLRIDTYDVDFTHRFSLWEDHAITWGAGYRLVHDELQFPNPIELTLDPASRTVNRYSAFIQDQITLLDDKLYFMLGSKFQHNDYTGFEYQPGGRLLWMIDERRAAWASVTRAVRTPSRFENDFRFLLATLNTMPLTTREALGNRDVISEELMAYELGYRAQPFERFSWDAALFFNQYEDLFMVAPATPFFSDGRVIAPLRVANDMDGEAYGLEISGVFDILPDWKLRAWYSFLQLQMHQSRGGSGSERVPEGASPHNQAFLMSSWNLPRHLELDLIARYVDSLPAVNTGSYISLDLRLGWRPTEHCEFSIVGQSLLEGHRRDFIDADGVITSSEVERGVYAQSTFRF